MYEQKGSPNGMNKKYAYIVAGLIVLAIIVWAIYAGNNQNNGDLGNGAGDSNNALSPANTSTSPTTGTTPPVDLSYEKAIKAYPYRFQFTLCHGNPGTLTVKRGSIVMMDNRDPKAHTFKADKETFNIKGYGYALLHTDVLTGANNTVTNITCDGGGAAVLNVQK